MAYLWAIGPSGPSPKIEKRKKRTNVISRAFPHPSAHPPRCPAARRYFAGLLARVGSLTRSCMQEFEENEGGARVMIEDGLFEMFPVEQVFGMHNMPWLGVGEMAVAASVLGLSGITTGYCMWPSRMRLNGG